MSCLKCVWFDKGTGKCIKKGRKVRRPLIASLFCKDYNRVPEVALNWLDSIAETTGLDREEVMRSTPFRNYLQKLRDVRL